jgi:hypothetical protein
MKKIKEFIKEVDLFFSFISKQTYGIINFEKDTVVINIDLLLVEVFIHEYIHWLHNDWSEKRVEKATTRKINRMTVMQIKQVCRFICKNAVIRR